MLNGVDTLDRLEHVREDFMRRAALNTQFINQSQVFQTFEKVSGFFNVQLHGHKFIVFISKNDDAVAMRLIWNHTYEPLSTRLWCERAAKAKNIVDVGAHTGVYSIIAAMSNPDAFVVSVEPNPMNFARLVVNVRENDLTNIGTVRAAASDETGNELFGTNTPPWYLSAGGKLGHKKPVEAYLVPTITVDTVGEVDLVKMDTEGGELRCLKGMPETLKRQPDILFECSTDKDEIFDLLHDYGYKTYSLNEEMDSVTLVDKALEGNSMATMNYLATIHGA